MKLFIDSADSSEIAGFRWMIDGVTTNPSLIAAQCQPEEANRQKIVPKILDIFGDREAPVSVQVAASSVNRMIQDAKSIRQYDAQHQKNVVIKLPMTDVGLQACRTLSDEKIPTNITLCFSVAQALLAAKAGATYVSPFIGRLEDHGADGIALVADILEVYRTYGFATQVLAASIRSVAHVEQVAALGCHAATVPPKILAQLCAHKLTTAGLARFDADSKPKPSS